MEREEYRRIFELETSHWWYLGMQKIVEVLLSPIKASGEKTVLDAGCGTGGMMLYLKKFGKVYGFDLSPQALKYCRRRHLRNIKLASIEKIPFSSESFDLITSFDVLYHQNVHEDKKALREFYRVLKPGGNLLIRVPAYNWLRGPHDKVVATRHRYTKEELESKLIKTGFLIQRLTYANSFLFLPIVIKRLIDTFVVRKIQSDVQTLPPVINTPLLYILYLEALVIKKADLPLGLSLFALAQKP